MVRRNRAMEDADKRPESCAGDEITASALSSVTPGHRKGRAAVPKRKSGRCPCKLAKVATPDLADWHKLKPGRRGTHDIGASRV